MLASHPLFVSLLLAPSIRAPGASFLGAGPEKQTEELLVPLPRRAPDPLDNPTTAEKIELGQQLFFDPRLSGDNNMSCASCHPPGKSFADGLPQALGRSGQRLDRNTPTLLNVAFYSTFFWDGRAGSLEEQALVPIQSPLEMNQNLAELERELNRIPAYVRQFQSVFGSKATGDAIAKALASFQRTLVTEPSPFDRYLEGEEDALSEEAKEGMELFMEVGCVRCHHGPLLTDDRFHRVRIGHGDLGRGAVTGEAGDNYRFRTPGLRNIAQTGPYMHNGSRRTLEDVVTFYYRGIWSTGGGDLPLDIEPMLDRSFSEISPIVTFLESLTGQAPKISPPPLP